jgi:hypothetical protein
MSRWRWASTAARPGELRDLLEEGLQGGRRADVGAHVHRLGGLVAVGVADAGGHDDLVARRAAPPVAAGEQARVTGQHVEALLHGGVDVRRDAAPRIDPRLDVEHGAAVGIHAVREPVALLEGRVLDHLAVHPGHLLT